MQEEKEVVNEEAKAAEQSEEAKTLNILGKID